MKIQGITNSIIKTLPKTQKITSGNFKNVVENIHKDSGFNQTLQEVYQQLDRGVQFQPKDFLRYQVQASNYLLKVELVSKAAESASGTLKKLQSPS